MHRGIDKRVTGLARAPGREIYLGDLPRRPADSLVFRAKRMPINVRKMVENHAEELAPDEFVQPAGRTGISPQGPGIDGCTHRCPHRQRTKAQMHGEP